MKNMGNEKNVKNAKNAKNAIDMMVEEQRDFTKLENRIMAGREAYQRIPVPDEMERRIRHVTAGAGRAHGLRIAVAAAAATAVLVVLPNTGADMAYAMGNLPVVGKLFQAVTFRDYQFESDRFNANVEIPQIVVEDVAGEKPESGAVQSETTGQEKESSDSGKTQEEAPEESKRLQETIEQVNFDIDKVTDQLVEEFKESAELGESYGSLEIHHETVTDNERYFTLKLSIYRGAGSGMESYKLYTIDKHSGLQVQLRDLFREDSGYREILSEEIRDQMRALMAEDEMKAYWVDQTDLPELNWEGLKEDQNFYFDADGNLVFVFDEYEVAPGYMGAQEFTVEKAVFEGMLR